MESETGNDATRSRLRDESEGLGTQVSGSPSTSLAGDGESLAASDGPAPPERVSGGSRLRLSILLANLLLLLASSIGSRFGDGSFGFFNDGNAWSFAWTFLQMLAQVVHFAPLLLASVLAAWGPWRPWIRGLAYAGIVMTAIGIRQRFGSDIIVAGIGGDQGLVSWLNESMSWFSVMVPAVFCLALAGSWLRLRIGPPTAPPVRVTILAVLIATAIVGVMMSGMSAVEEIYLRMNSELVDLDAEYSVYETSMEARRESRMWQTAVTGPLCAVLLGCLVAASYQWWARCVLAALITAYAGAGWYMTMQAAPQFPAGQFNILAIVYGSLITGVVFTCLWIALCVRQLGRSGWPCSRRIGMTARGSRSGSPVMDEFVPPVA